MALPKSEVEKAIKVLTDCLNAGKERKYRDDDDEEGFIEGAVEYVRCENVVEFKSEDRGIVYPVRDKVQGIHPHGGGWGNVFIVVTKFSSYQFRMWERRKEEVSNTAFMRLEDGILMLGFF